MSKIVFLGVGNMGGSFLRGLQKSGETELGFYTPNSANNDLSCTRFATQEEAIAWADIVVLGIKPQVFNKIKGSFPQTKQTWISLMAGITIQSLREALGEQAIIVRTMPNLPLTQGAGATAIVSDGLTQTSLTQAIELFSKVGSAIPVAESQIDAVTGVSGSGPAWVFQFVDAWIQGGILSGLSAVDSEELALTTLEGSLKLLRNSGKSAADLTKLVCSPGGTTIAGVHSLEKDSFKASVMNAVAASTQRSKELG